MSDHDIDASFIWDIILSALGAVSHDSGVGLPWGFFFALEVVGMTPELRRRRGERLTGTSGVSASVFVLFLARRRDDFEVCAGGVAAWSLESRLVWIDAGGGLTVFVRDEALRRWFETEVLVEIMLDGSGVGLFALRDLCRARFLADPCSAFSTDCRV